MFRNGGTCAFEAPETHTDDHKPLPLDVWGLGVAIVCVVCGHLPFPGLTTREMEESVQMKEPCLSNVEMSTELR